MILLRRRTDLRRNEFLKEKEPANRERDNDIRAGSRVHPQAGQPAEERFLCPREVSHAPDIITGIGECGCRINTRIKRRGKHWHWK